MNSVVNVHVGKSEDRTLLTGVHTVCSLPRLCPGYKTYDNLSPCLVRLQISSASDAPVTLGGHTFARTTLLRSIKRVMYPLVVPIYHTHQWVVTGKYIVEMQRIVKDNAWRLED